MRTQTHDVSQSLTGRDRHEITGRYRKSTSQSVPGGYDAFWHKRVRYHIRDIIENTDGKGDHNN